MITILTHQSTQNQGKDVLIINGEKSFYSGNQTQIDALKRFRDIANPEYKKRIPLICKSAGITPSFKIYISNSGETVFSSNFETTDEKGRNISYDYYCDSIDNPEAVVRVFSDDSRIAGMKPNPADLKALNKYLVFYKHKGRNYALIWMAAAAAFIALVKIIINIASQI